MNNNNIWKAKNLTEAMLLIWPENEDQGMFFKKGEEISDSLCSEFNLTHNDVVLDYGSGIGRISIPLSKHVKKVYSVDISSDFLNILNESKGENTKIETVLLEKNFLDTSFFRENIDFVLFFNSSFHIDKPFFWANMKIISSILSENGRVFVNFTVANYGVKNSKELEELIDRIEIAIKNQEVFMRHEIYTLEEIKYRSEKSGFNIEVLSENFLNVNVLLRPMKKERIRTKIPILSRIKDTDINEISRRLNKKYLLNRKENKINICICALGSNLYLKSSIFFIQGILLNSNISPKSIFLHTSEDISKNYLKSLDLLKDCGVNVFSHDPLGSNMRGVFKYKYLLKTFNKNLNVNGVMLFDADCFLSNRIEDDYLFKNILENKIMLLSSIPSGKFYDIFLERKSLSVNFFNKSDNLYIESWYEFFKKYIDISLMDFTKTIRETSWWYISGICGFPKDVLEDKIFKDICYYAEKVIGRCCDETVFLLYSLFFDHDITFLDNNIKFEISNPPNYNVINPTKESIEYAEGKNRIFHFTGIGERKDYEFYIDNAINKIKCHKSLIESIPYPREIQIEITKKCPFDCIMCHSRTGNEKTLDFDMMKSLEEPISKAEHIILSGDGEPLALRDIGDRIKYIRNTNPNVTIDFITSGMYFTDRNINMLIDCGVNGFSLSIESPLKDVYNYIRRGCDFDTLVSNLDNLNKIKKQRGVQFPHFKILMIAMTDNAHQIPEMVRFANKYGAYSLEITPLFETYDAIDKKFNNSELANIYFKEASILAKDFGIGFYHYEIDGCLSYSVEPDKYKVPKLHCLESHSNHVCNQKWPWHGCYINSNGRIYPDCYWQDPKSNPDHIMGNLNNETFYDIWNGDKYNKLRKSLNEGFMPNGCHNCITIKDLVNKEHIKKVGDWFPDYIKKELEDKSYKIEDNYIPLKMSSDASGMKYFEPLRDNFPEKSNSNVLRYCDWYYEHIVVLSDGRVTTCCADWEGENSMGNIYEKDILDIWDGDKFKEFRRRNKEYGACGASKKCKECAKYMDKRIVTHEELEYIAPIKAPFPKTLQIESFSACNADCTECNFAKGMNINKYRSIKIMPFEEFKKIIDSVYLYVDNVRFYNYGEHFLHKQSFDMVKYVREKRPDMFIYTSTNFWYFNEDKIRKIINCGIDRIVVSLHGGSQETAQGYMPIVDFDSVVNNMKRFIEIRNEMGFSKPEIGWKSVLFPWNDSEEDMQRMRDLANKIGVDRYGWELSGTASVSKKYYPGSDGHKKLIKNGEIFGW